MNSKTISLIVVTIISSLLLLPIIIGNVKTNQRYDSYRDCRAAMHNVADPQVSCRHLYDDYRK